MKTIKYTKTTLDKFTQKELQKICKYYGIEFAPSWSKAKLVKAILAYTPSNLIGRTYTPGNSFNYEYPSVDIPIAEAKKSIRIQRIEDRKEK